MRRAKKLVRTDESLFIHKYVDLLVEQYVEIRMQEVFSRPNWEFYCDKQYIKLPKDEALKKQVASRTARWATWILKFSFPLCVDGGFIKKIVSIFMEKPYYYTRLITDINAATPFTLPALDNPRWDFIRVTITPVTHNTSQEHPAKRTKTQPIVHTLPNGVVFVEQIGSPDSPEQPPESPPVLETSQPESQIPQLPSSPGTPFFSPI